MNDDFRGCAGVLGMLLLGIVGCLAWWFVIIFIPQLSRLGFVTWVAAIFLSVILGTLVRSLSNWINQNPGVPGNRGRRA